MTFSAPANVFCHSQHSAAHEEWLIAVVHARVTCDKRYSTACERWPRANRTNSSSMGKRESVLASSGKGGELIFDSMFRRTASQPLHHLQEPSPRLKGEAQGA